MKTRPTEAARKTIEYWLQRNLSKELSSCDVLPQVVADFPENTGRVNSTTIKSVKKIDLSSMELKILSHSVGNATFIVILSFSLYVNKEDYDSSQEVRDFVGVHNDDFSGMYADTDVKLVLSYDFELLGKQPMVISTSLLTIAGESRTYRFN